MKRNMDLVRAILLSIEDRPDPSARQMEELDVPGYPDSAERRKHLVMMAEAGFLVCEPVRSSTNPDRIVKVVIFDLTWKGHEFLDAIRDPELWKQTKAGAKKVGNSSFEFIFEVAKAMGRNALEQVGLPVT